MHVRNDDVRFMDVRRQHRVTDHIDEVVVAGHDGLVVVVVVAMAGDGRDEGVVAAEVELWKKSTSPGAARATISASVRLTLAPVGCGAWRQLVLWSCG
jgi:hypothetical protein